MNIKLRKNTCKPRTTTKKIIFKRVLRNQKGNETEYSKKVTSPPKKRQKKKKEETETIKRETNSNMVGLNPYQ